jgi:hypothetical protein
MIGDSKFEYRETKNLFDDLFHKGELCECGHSVFEHSGILYREDYCEEALCKCNGFTKMSNLTYLTTRPGSTN